MDARGRRRDDLLYAAGLGDEVLEDLRGTQQVIPVIRWFLLATAMFLTNYRTGGWSNTQLTVNNVAIWGLTLFNAFLHARSFIGRPLGPYPVLLASVLDVLVISALLGISADPFQNNFFIFYYAAIFGFALVFPPIPTIVFSLVTGLVYSLICVLIPGRDGFGLVVSEVTRGGTVISGGEEKLLIIRIMVMLAIATGASLFWRLQRQRRSESVRTQLAVLQAGLENDPQARNPQGPSGA